VRATSTMSTYRLSLTGIAVSKRTHPALESRCELGSYCAPFEVVVANRGSNPEAANPPLTSAWIAAVVKHWR
jgi:hypothetical protein